MFDRCFCAFPGPTNPNRAYLTSRMSHGHGKNDAVFHKYALPQRSIFQQLGQKGISWINYQNSTTGPGKGFLPDAAFCKWSLDTGTNSTNILPF